MGENALPQERKSFPMPGIIPGRKVQIARPNQDDEKVANQPYSPSLNWRFLGKQKRVNADLFQSPIPVNPLTFMRASPALSCLWAKTPPADAPG
jgi:hypothetical protein